MTVERPSAGALPTRRGLFVRRFPGDDALLELARLRFAQTGLGAELYADGPDQLAHDLAFAPAEPAPTVHLSRDLNLLGPGGRALVVDFAHRFAGRIWGMIVHDRPEMGTRPEELVAAMRELEGRLPPDGPWVFLEYAAGLAPDRFVEIAERLRGLSRITSASTSATSASPRPAGASAAPIPSWTWPPWGPTTAGFRASWRRSRSQSRPPCPPCST
jgi:hypothetical protein